LSRIQVLKNCPHRTDPDSTYGSVEQIPRHFNPFHIFVSYFSDNRFNNTLPSISVLLPLSFPPIVSVELGDMYEL